MARAARNSEDVLATASGLERPVIDLETACGFVLTGEEQLSSCTAPPPEGSPTGHPAARSAAATADGERRVSQAGRVRRLHRSRAPPGIGPAEASDEAARRAVVAAVGGLAVSLLLVLGVAGYLARVIVRPVLRAAQMAVRLAGGNLSTRMPMTGVAEIGRLERGVNEMAGSPERNRDDLAEHPTEQAALRRHAHLRGDPGRHPDQLQR